jgi:hypothetical protein
VRLQSKTLGDIANADVRMGTSLAETLSDSSQAIAYPHSPIGKVADLMVESGVGRIPIVEAGPIEFSASSHAIICSRSEAPESAQRSTEPSKAIAMGIAVRRHTGRSG